MLLSTYITKLNHAPNHSLWSLDTLYKNYTRQQKLSTKSLPRSTKNIYNLDRKMQIASNRRIFPQKDCNQILTSALTERFASTSWFFAGLLGSVEVWFHHCSSPDAQATNTKFVTMKTASVIQKTRRHCTRVL